MTYVLYGKLWNICIWGMYDGKVMFVQKQDQNYLYNTLLWLVQFWTSNTRIQSLGETEKATKAIVSCYHKIVAWLLKHEESLKLLLIWSASWIQYLPICTSKQVKELVSWAETSYWKMTLLVLTNFRQSLYFSFTDVYSDTK